jgi:hypothetical protein
MFTIPNANALVDYIRDFTGSGNSAAATAEIKQCIFLGELSMRNLEIPALRSDPYDPLYIGVVDSTGAIPIPGDMNKPILFFKQGQQYILSASANGTSGQTTITLSATPSRTITQGMTVSGTGIATGATVTQVNNLVITLSLANTGTVSGTVVFQTPAPASQQSQTGPWIVYDRIGDRDIITQSMIAQLYLQPVNVPAVIRGKFSEVGQKYKFLPYTAEGDLINMYYYKAWALLFAPVDDILISTTGTVGAVTGSGTTGSPWSTTITGMTTTNGIEVGNQIIATAGTGSLGSGGTVEVVSVDSATQITVSKVGGTIPTAGTITDVKLTNLDTQTNPVLQTFPEGYVYATLREYYLKRHNETDAATYEGKFQQAVATVSDQNNLAKWSGGHTRLTSVWQPRQYRQYNIK